MDEPNACPGPLVWFPAGEARTDDGETVELGAVLECGACGWFTTTSNPLDMRHRDTMCVRTD